MWFYSAKTPDLALRPRRGFFFFRGLLQKKILSRTWSFGGRGLNQLHTKLQVRVPAVCELDGKWSNCSYGCEQTELQVQGGVWPLSCCNLWAPAGWKYLLPSAVDVVKGTQNKALPSRCYLVSHTLLWVTLCWVWSMLSRFEKGINFYLLHFFTSTKLYFLQIKKKKKVVAFISLFLKIIFVLNEKSSSNWVQKVRWELYVKAGIKLFAVQDTALCTICSAITIMLYLGKRIWFWRDVMKYKQLARFCVRTLWYSWKTVGRNLKWCLYFRREQFFMHCFCCQMDCKLVGVQRREGGLSCSPHSCPVSCFIVSSWQLDL